MQPSQTATQVTMVDASTSTEAHLFQMDKAVQWPEYEFNTEGEQWKVESYETHPRILQS